jgi:hypothetical protein
MHATFQGAGSDIFYFKNRSYPTWGNQDEPKWIPYNRSQETEVNPHRIQYLKSIGIGA